MVARALVGGHLSPSTKISFFIVLVIAPAVLIGASALNASSDREQPVQADDVRVTAPCASIRYAMGKEKLTKVRLSSSKTDPGHLIITFECSSRVQGAFDIHAYPKARLTLKTVPADKEVDGRLVLECDSVELQFDYDK
jgi:hypothetical protein